MGSDVSRVVEDLNRDNPAVIVISSDEENDSSDNCIDVDDEFIIKKSCIACLEKKNIQRLKKSTVNCKHEQDICRKCFSSHVKSRLDDKGDVTINCPTLSCKEIISPSDVKRFRCNKLYERLDTLLLRQGLSKLPEFRWCKSSGCGSGQIHDGGDSAQIMRCNACNAKSCFTHDIPWHEDLTCKQYDEVRKGDEAATRDYLQRETKTCPKCGIRITKNGGCNHMTCRVASCKYEFCWLCLADYNAIRKKGNKSHKPTCQYYA